MSERSHLGCLHTTDSPANRFAILGTALLAVSVGAVVFLISDILFGARLAALFTAPVAAFLAWAWFGLPLFRRVREGDL